MSVSTLFAVKQLTVITFFLFNLTVAKYVSVTMDSKWPDTPILSEAGEYFRKEWPILFWMFLDEVCNEPTIEEICMQNTELCKNATIAIADKFLPPLSKNMFRLRLNTRSYSPSVEMMRKLATEEREDDCETFVKAGDIFTCETRGLDGLLKTLKESSSAQIYDFDLPHLSNSVPSVVLYSKVGSKECCRFHQILKKHSTDGHIQYYFRHNFKPLDDKKTRLYGYGVELQLKSTEYKAKDDEEVDNLNSSKAAFLDDIVHGFDFGRLSELYPGLRKELTDLRKHLLSNESEISPLKPWETQDLSFQVAQLVMDSPPEVKLDKMIDYAHNFLLHLREISQVSVSQKLRNSVSSNAGAFLTTFGYEWSSSEILINGRQMNTGSLGLYGLMQMITDESRLFDSLYDVGVQSSDVINKLLLLIQHSSSKNDYLLDFRNDSIVWLNDLESDSEYRGWSPRVVDILNILPLVRKNLYHLVIYIDPSNIDQGTTHLLSVLEGFLMYKFPIRLGLVMVPSRVNKDDVGVYLFRAFQYYVRKKDSRSSLAFLIDILKRRSKIEKSDVLDAFKHTFSKKTVKDVFTAGKIDLTDVERTVDYFSKTGLGKLPQAIFNGKVLPTADLESERFEETIRSLLFTEKIWWRNYILSDSLSMKTNLLDFYFSKVSAKKRLNYYILSKSNSYLDFTFSSMLSSSTTDKRIHLARLMKHLNYIFKRDDLLGDSQTFPVTLWVVCDPDSPDSRKLMLSAIEFLKATTKTRLTFVMNPMTAQSSYSKLVIELQKCKRGMVFTRNLLKKLLKSGANDSSLPGKEYDEFLSEIDPTNSVLDLHRQFCDNVLGFKPGESGVIANGRILGPFHDEFIREDFEFLEEIISHDSYAIKDVLQDKLTDPDDGFMKIYGILHKYGYHKRFNVPFNPSFVQASSSSFPIYIHIFIDPVSTDAQRILPLIKLTREFAKISVFLLCKQMLSEVPLKSFYGVALPESTGVIIKNVPSTPLFTLNVNSPQSWMIEVVSAKHDLNNIKLSEITSMGIDAYYQLEYILVEGQCFDDSQLYPRGLQITLSNFNKQPVFDTIVMSNLGYFQLKSFPGVWELNLREGRSKELYDITLPPNKTHFTVVTDSFEGTWLTLRVTKKPSKVNEHLLDDLGSSSKSWKNYVLGTDNGKDETLNIFSIASGHLYERFLRIMMLSVIKHTKKSKIKFWFLKNFLSPTFISFLPYYASQYHFEYELVQYKWPRWLTVYPTDKQRVIWGYKILFLDVLFPLSVRRMIFVDADQVVRADLTELRDMDLQGAPYGYTPFCDSREDMEGYRFWKTGYWADHLGRRKYHISALYVIDMKRFRLLAAGDRLRGQYFALSQDPHSLSNLDQDLPNNMIHHVNIFSLPQEWLWCETWCDDASKAKAKTIDLCNNPKTKEPKLKSAMRIIPEWKSYDDEIRKLMLKWSNKSVESAPSKSVDPRIEL